MADIEITVTEPGPPIELTAVTPAEGSPWRDYTPVLSTIDIGDGATQPAYDLADESGPYGAPSYAQWKVSAGMAAVFFRMVMIPAAPGELFSDQVDLGAGRFALSLPVTPAVLAADYGAGSMVSIQGGGSEALAWSVQFILDPFYDEEQVLIGRADTVSNIATGDQTLDPPPTFLAGEGPGEWTDAGSLTSTALFVVLRGRLSYPVA